MKTIYDWAHRWNIPLAAIRELQETFGAHTTPDLKAPERSETHVQSLVRLEAARKGVYLWRNNVGAGMLDNGSFVRWGLANESEQQNTRIKSHDLVGIRPVTITPTMVGTVLGQFTSRECKSMQWSYTATPREQAQLAFAALVNSLGGDARFANTTGTI